MRIRRFALFSWFTLTYTLAVILWGAYVRATGSGAGCGNHWPLCNGEVVPRSSGLETLIEFTHRATSGLALILVVILVIWAFRLYPPGSPVRRGAAFTLFFMITEAVVGAGLVLFELVGQNDSLTRASVMAIHLINTFFLLAALTFTCWSSTGSDSLHWEKQKRQALLLLGVLVLLSVLGASGAVTALGDTIFPAETLREALEADISPTAHILIRLRLYHPLLALLTALAVLIASAHLAAKRPAANIRYLRRWMMALIFLQLAAGFLNVWLLAPIWLQIVHLLLADLIWVAAVLFSLSYLQQFRPADADA